jgi:hypothetical protein
VGGGKLNEIFLGNLEGVLISILGYFIFVKFFPLEKIENEVPYEKPLSLKRMRYGFVPVAYFALMVCLLIVQARRNNDSDPFSVTWKIYFGYCLFSIYAFVIWPMFKFLSKKRSD